MTHLDRLDHALEELLADRSPTADAQFLDDGERDMLRMAQLLRGSRTPAPAPQFVDQLRQTVLAPQPVPITRISRRAAFLGGIGTLAAGLVAGIGLERAHDAGEGTKYQTASPPAGELVGADGHWVHVATVAEVPHGAIHQFTAGSVQGFLINKNGSYRAVSRICTHMGCALTFKREAQGFVCPCHGAEFEVSGQSRVGPGGYSAPLSPLPKLHVRVKDKSVQVWAI